MEELVSPFDESSTDPQAPAPRLASLEGKRLTLLSISKPKSAEFLDVLETILTSEHGAAVDRKQKPTFTRPAPADLVDEITEVSDAVIEALAD
jgi:hypothetical protein